jgi:hypothetical protein
MSDTSRNIALCWPTRITEDITIGGGSWLAAAPASNVATEQATETARSTNALTSSTKITFDLGQTRVLRGFAMGHTNIDADGSWRILLGTSSGGSQVLATAWTDCWHLDHRTALAALGLEPNSSSVPTDEDIIMFLDAYYTARYITLEIDNTTNADGFIEIGTFFAGGALIPGENASYGLRRLRKSQSTVSRSDSGSQWRYRRARMKGEQFSLEWLTPTEGVYVDEMMRQIDTTDVCLYIADRGDPVATQRYGFIGLLRELSDIEYPRVNTNSVALALDRLV